MAVTLMSSVRSSAAEAAAYIKNPEKTTLDPEKNGKGLGPAHGDGPERVLLVSGVRCSVDRAVEEMTAVQKHFGESGEVKVYHAIQCFNHQEVDPRKAHRLGVETAVKVWGGKYQVLVATHLNTQCVHNHFVINAYSYLDGKKYTSTNKNFRFFREVSDRICRENGLSVLDDKYPLTGMRKLYWVHKDGKMTPLDVMKEEVLFCLKNAESVEGFAANLQKFGYELDMERFAVRVPGMKAPVFLERFGLNSTEDIRKNLLRPSYSLREDLHRMERFRSALPASPIRRFDLSRNNVPQDYGTWPPQKVFALMSALNKESLKTPAAFYAYRPQYPLARMEAAHAPEIHAEYRFLTEKDLQTSDGLREWVSKTEDRIRESVKKRNALQSKARRTKDPDERVRLRTEAKKITEELKGVRGELKTAKSALDRLPYLVELLNRERQIEIPDPVLEQYRQRNRSSRGFDR